MIPVHAGVVKNISTAVENKKLTNAQIAGIFREIARLMEKDKENWFKIRAYRKVSDEIDKLQIELVKMAEESRLREIPGVGEAISKKINEMLDTGKLQFYERLKAEVGETAGEQVNK